MLFFIFIIIPIVLASQGPCLNLRGQSLTIIDARQMLNTDNNIRQCLQNALTLGKTNIIKSVIQVYGNIHKHIIKQQLQKQIERLITIAQQTIVGESTCTPVLKWGQNKTHLFISTKLSHRWDSPPCLKTQKQIYQVNTTTFQYINICLVSHQKITFKINLNFYKTVKNEGSVLNKDGVGTYTAIFQKQQQQVWPFLDQQQKSYPLWEQIIQRHNSVFKEYEQLNKQALKQKQSKTSTNQIKNTTKQNQTTIQPQINQSEQFKIEQQKNIQL